MSLEEFWNCFYDDTAPFFIAQSVVDAGDTVETWSNWDDPANAGKEYLMSGWDKDTISWRNYNAHLHVSDNPFGANDVTELKNILLLEKTDTNITIKEVMELSDVMYTSRF